MLESIQAKGKEIEKRFHTRNLFKRELNDEFISVAFDTLKSLSIDADKLLTQIMRGENQTEQYAPNHKFPDARFTLFNGVQFVIEINVWQNSFTEAHEHGFVGAFKLVKGAAFNAKYSFKKMPSQSFKPDLLSGERALTDLIDIESNKPQIISYGHNFIHKIVHLDSPSATLIIRTKASTNKKKRYIYNPKLAYFPSYYSDKLHQVSEYINVCAQLSEDKYWEACVKAIEILSPKELFYFLIKQVGTSSFTGCKNKIFGLVENKHGKNFVDLYIRPITDDFEKDVTLGRLRSFSVNSKAKVLLSALILCGTVKSARQVLNQYFKDEIPIGEAEAELWALNIIDSDVGLTESSNWDYITDLLKNGKPVDEPLLSVIRELP